MSKYFYDVNVRRNGELTLHFKHDIKYTTRVRIAKRIQKKGKRKVTLYPDGRLEVFGNPQPSYDILTGEQKRAGLHPIRRM